MKDANDDALRWEILSTDTLFHHNVMDVLERKERASDGQVGRYVAVHTFNWVIVIPVRDGKFVMVRQWRHGMGGITVEFPGGVMETGETPEEGGYRELLEETGYKAGRITVLGRCNPNPAIYDNTATFVLAEDLTPTGELHPDDDEFVAPMEIPIETVIERFGVGEYCNAFVGTGLALYLRHVREGQAAGQPCCDQDGEKNFPGREAKEMDSNTPYEQDPRTDKPRYTEESVDTLYDAKYVRLYDLRYSEGKHYCDASRREKKDLVALKSDEEFQSMKPDAVTIAVVVNLPGEAPKLLLNYEFRYPVGQYLLSPVAGLIDPEDYELSDTPLVSAAIREIHEECGLVVKPSDKVKVINPCAFSSPGMTDESNAFLCAEITVEDTAEVTQDGCVGTELFAGFELVDVPAAEKLYATGRDRYGNFFSLATWVVLGYFIANYR